MKKLGWILAYFAFLSLNAQAGLPPTTAKGQTDAGASVTFNLQAPASQMTRINGTTALIETGSSNLLANPSFEAATPTSWTASAGTLNAQTGTIKSDAGKQAASWALSAATGSVLQDVTPSQALTGVNIESSCWVNTTATTFQLCGRQGGAERQCVSIPSTGGNWQKYSIILGAPSSGSIGVDVSTTASTTGTIYVDQCYVGSATNLAQVSQARLIGQVKITGCTGSWDTTSTTLAAPSAQTSCVYTVTPGTSCAAPSTNIPGITCPSLPPGSYTLKYEGTTLESYASAAGSSYYQFWDGTNAANEISAGPAAYSAAATITASGFQQTIAYTTAQSNLTLSVRERTSNAGATASLFGTTTNPGVISVYYTPLSNQTAYGANQQLLPTVQKFTSGSGTYTTPAGVSWIHVRMVGGGGGGAGSGTSSVTGTAGTSSTFGTLTANGGNPGTNNGGPSVTGTIGAGWTGSLIPSNSGGAGGNSTGAGTYPIGGVGGGSGIFGGGGPAGATNAPGSDAPANTGGGGGGAGSPTQGHLGGGGGSGGGGVDVISSGAPLATYSYSIGGGGAHGVGSDATGAVGGSGYIEVTEYYGSQPYPLLVGSLTSPSSGQEYGTHARFTCGNSGSTVGNQGGSWLSIANGAGTGACTLTFSGFSGEPGCTLGLIGAASTAASSCTFDAAPTSTGVAVSRVRGGASENGQCEITCMGPR